MRVKTSLSLILLMLLIIGSFSSCGNRKETEPASQEPGKLYRHQFQRKLETINPGLKDPAGIIQLLEMTGAEFIPGLVNDEGLDSIYIQDSSIAAINLGIYTVDLVYLLAYEKDEKADNQLERARILADNIGAGHLYDHAMYNRYWQAGVSSDTLIKYLSKASEAMEYKYEEMELLRLYTLFATEEFIEKLHLTTNLLIHADEKDADYYWTIMILVFQQERDLDSLILLLDQIRGEEEGERFMAMMKDLKHIFMELNNSDELAGINTRNITENQVFQDLFEQLTYIRKYIILSSRQ